MQRKFHWRCFHGIVSNNTLRSTGYSCSDVSECGYILRQGIDDDFLSSTDFTNRVVVVVVVEVVEVVYDNGEMFIG